MANANIVDELLVLLRLDTSQYKKADKEVEKQVTTTEKKLKKVDDARNKRMKESSAAVKQFAGQLRSFALTVGSVLGIGGGAAGLVQAVVALTNFETGLRRASVSTGLSNREMQAWGSAARRLGADAEAGRAAIADLAREQKQFHLTGSAPTMQAFARMGINVSPDASITDILANAQRVYRGSSAAQQGQIESGLSASGVSNDLILLIKSEKNVREEFARSYAESATENRKALDSVTNALEAAKNSALNIANALASALQPQIEQFAQWLSKGAQQVSAFVDKVIAAGGGVQGFTKVLDAEAPELARLMRALGTAIGFLGEGLDVVIFGFKKLAAAAEALYNWIDEKVGYVIGGPGKVKGAVADFGEGVAKGWRMLVGEARTGSPGGGVILTPEAQARLAAGASGGSTAGSTAAAAPTGSAPVAPRGGSGQDDVMRGLIARGFTVDQAAAVAANIKHESNYNPAAYNPAGGGIGAHGLFQLRGDRAKAFQARYGKLPSQATIDEQLDFFASNDPEEARSRRAAFASGGTAAQLGTAVSAKYERHGNVAEDLRRGQTAATIAGQYGQQQASVGQQINLNGPITVQANNPQELVGGIQRVGGATNYNSAVR
ncbi:phage tail tip lysozyme [uncultured Bradyrhizobium sp.]|uniref:Phage tail lysozyme domain-containing protein n=1 Tax=Candidatus Afipia apatlaquensis TaxID=2712852 RepID=A0A7C9RG74_9BRAD|nr:phage tail tip lysozyme [uncultured Bradyrhizobium sp.]NGX96358.1 hypothetical protein [Candidatus Afipia apatlaquensis]